MKQVITSILFTILMSMVGIKMNAYDFQKDGFYYNLSPSDMTAIVTYGESLYEGNVIIPNEVSYNGRTMIVKWIGNDAFKDCVDLSSVQFSSSITYIDKSAFQNCTKIRRLTIPSNITHINEGAFWGCTSLEELIIEDGKSTLRCGINGDQSPSSVFDCKLKYLYIGRDIGKPEWRYSYNLDNTNLSTIIIGSGKTFISGFKGSKITEITIPSNVTGIREGCFKDCKSLKSVIFEDGNKQIVWQDAYDTDINGRIVSVCPFYDCPIEDAYIGRIIVPTNNNIRLSSYDGPFDRTSIMHVTISNSLTSLCGFNYCDNLKEIDIPASVNELYGFSNCNSLLTIKCRSTTPPNLKGGFVNNTYLHGTLYVPKGSKSIYEVTNIWKYFFNIQEFDDEGTGGGETSAVEIDGIYYNLIQNGKIAEVTKNPNKYTGSVVIPEFVTYGDVKYSVTTIVDEAFRDCAGLTSVTIGNSVTSIGKDAFQDCTGLKKVIVSDIAAWCGISFYNSTANPLYHAHHLYSDENTEIKDLIIPNGVVSIGSNAFRVCTGLTSVTIPNSVTSIGNYAFKDCNGLKKVIVSDIAAWCGIEFEGLDANPLTLVKHLYSDENTEIKDLVIPNSVTSIGNSAFSGCSGLASIIIPNSVKSIGSDVFSFCTGLTSVTIGNSVTNIGEGAFYECSALTSVTIPNSVTSIGAYTFMECTSLTSVTIGNSVTSIGTQAFFQCTGLISVTIPNSVTSIGGGAFANCDLPVVISLIENPFTIYSNTFSNNTFNNATLYVPLGTIDKYKATEGWKDFENIVEGVPSGIKGILLDNDKNDPIYNINGRKLETPQKGINIINGKKIIMK